jgi:hypothetical protein
VRSGESHQCIQRFRRQPGEDHRCAWDVLWCGGDTQNTHKSRKRVPKRCQTVPNGAKRCRNGAKRCQTGAETVPNDAQMMPDAIRRCQTLPRHEALKLPERVCEREINTGGGEGWKERTPKIQFVQLVNDSHRRVPGPSPNLALATCPGPTTLPYRQERESRPRQCRCRCTTVTLSTAPCPFW